VLPVGAELLETALFENHQALRVEDRPQVRRRGDDRDVTLSIEHQARPRQLVRDDPTPGAIGDPGLEREVAEAAQRSDLVSGNGASTANLMVRAAIAPTRGPGAGRAAGPPAGCK